MSRDLSKYIGMEFKPFAFEIERGKIREFAMAIGDENELYVNQAAARDAGLPDVTVPPTFGTVMNLWGDMDFEQLCAVLEMDSLKVLHGEMEYEYFGLIHPGDTLSVTTVVASARSKSSSSGGMNLFKLESTYVNQRGETVLIGRSTVIEQH
ncbi:MAG: MaoC family dehydratase N-terminal domain-containing protein [Tumebacillaceae bacterium]